MSRETCLYCEQDGKIVRLVPAGRFGKACPIHSRVLLEALHHNARLTLGLPDLALLGRGVPNPRSQP